MVGHCRCVTATNRLVKVRKYLRAVPEEGGVRPVNPVNITPWHVRFQAVLQQNKSRAFLSAETVQSFYYAGSCPKPIDVVPRNHIGILRPGAVTLKSQKLMHAALQ